jgi:hypothetical protein
LKKLLMPSRNGKLQLFVKSGTMNWKPGGRRYDHQTRTSEHREEIMNKERPYIRLEISQLPEGASRGMGYQGEGEYWFVTDPTYRGFWVSPEGKIVELVDNPAFKWVA